MAEIREKDLEVLSCLRRNSRETLTSMSKKTGIPVSSLFDRIRMHEHGLIVKYTALVDFARLGCAARATVILKVGKKDKEALKDFLAKNSSVNSAYRINNGYDFMAEVVFRDMAELERFVEHLDAKFSIREKKVLYLIDELRKEAFLTGPVLSALPVAGGSR